MTHILIVAGSRDLNDIEHLSIVRKAVDDYIAKHGRPDEVWSGGCRGADRLGETVAKALGIRLAVFPADWSEGLAAGPHRNSRMIRAAHGLVVVRFPDSRGSRDVLRKAVVRGLHIIDVVLERKQP